MSAPTLNYTFPTTGVVKQVQLGQTPSIVLPPAFPSMVAGRQVAFQVFQVPSDQLLVKTAKQMSPLPTVIQTTDTLPVGRMLINTFPSIYQQAGSGHTLVPTPRVFPSIFLDHTSD